MLTLEGDGLSAELLDPRADLARLGSRYVAGGYVWQVTDAKLGPLFAGPCFPAEPPPFDGQGLPEVFELALGQHEARPGDEVYVLGVGRVLRESPVKPFHVRDNPTVTERASWQLTHDRNTLAARTAANFRDFAFTLERTVELRGRTLTSTTALHNRGPHELPVRWFAHPFFPWAGDRIARLSLEWSLPEGAPLHEDPSGALARRPGISWERGHYLLPRVALGGELEIEHHHPQLGSARIRCRFPLGGLALWGNPNTFSCEPFFQTLLAPASTAQWSIEYALLHPGGSA